MERKAVSSLTGPIHILLNVVTEACLCVGEDTLVVLSYSPISAGKQVITRSDVASSFSFLRVVNAEIRLSLSSPLSRLHSVKHPTLLPGYVDTSSRLDMLSEFLTLPG